MIIFCGGNVINVKILENANIIVVDFEIDGLVPRALMMTALMRVMVSMITENNE